MENYNETKPEFLLLYLVHHVAQDIWAFAFWEGDMGRAEYVAKAHERIQATFFDGAKVKFRPDSAWQEEVAAQLTDVPVVTNDEIYERFLKYLKGCADLFRDGYTDVCQFTLEKG